MKEYITGGKLGQRILDAEVNSNLSSTKNTHRVETTACG